jgi:hypothetical protein
MARARDEEHVEEVLKVINRLTEIAEYTYDILGHCSLLR